MVARDGIEPPTPAFSGLDSPIQWLPVGWGCPFPVTADGAIGVLPIAAFVLVLLDHLFSASPYCTRCDSSCTRKWTKFLMAPVYPLITKGLSNRY